MAEINAYKIENQVALFNSDEMAKISEGTAAATALQKQGTANNKIYKLGDKDISGVGWSMDVFEQHIANHRVEKSEEKKWCNPHCCSKFVFGQNTKDNRRKIRQRLTRSFHEMLVRGRFLAINYAERGFPRYGKAESFRFFTPEDDRTLVEQFFRERFGKMRSRLELTQKDMDTMESILQR